MADVVWSHRWQPTSCPTLWDPIDGSPPGSPVPGILKARTLEWVAISFSNVWKWKVKVKSLSRVQLLVIPRTAAYQAPPSMGFSRQGNWGSAKNYTISKPQFKTCFIQQAFAECPPWVLSDLCILPQSHVLAPIIILCFSWRIAIVYHLSESTSGP